ncbi:MAG: branched-chain amino acid ABC transporter permease [Chloroflexi bacterium]|nr:branched-chain amino acid ABC transporter permease [Chloroflexota bacterium]MCH8894068.1 branched-chain amino acid ABC transporter permease [Chloroflexota bacterium]MCI0849249.1 branched-chain amino acid ABC transporter permease [Chloroflexota bacterium]MCI0898606.1 branched-chain amino acid ABC transporter permease [Chloroflexota bacterium]MCI0901688.1 branched-chain amino acid ABC transporter permease [Chloroflexota bacterium]
MDLFLQQFTSGIASGSLFAILALAIVLTYRSTGTLNFAQGQMAMFTTFIAWSALGAAMGFWLTFFLTLLAAAAMGALVERLVVRHIEGTSELNNLIVALGLFLIFDGLALYIWGPLPRGFGPFSLFAGSPTCVGDVCIGRLNLGILAAAVIVMVLLFLLFQRTKFGLAMRATAQNRIASQLVGIPVGRMLSFGWGLGAAVGAVAGILVAQNLGLDTGTMFTVLLFALAAAILGGLDSPVGAVLGGLAIGVVKNMAGTYVPSSVGGTDLTVAFAMIVLVLMVRPSGIFGRTGQRRV